MQYQLTFGQAIQSVFNKYATFTGRASRSEYWWWVLFTFIVSVVFNIIGVKWLTGIVNLALFLPGLAVLVRRLHDIDKSGWWAALLYGIGAVCGGLGAGVIFNPDNSPLAIATGASGLIGLVFGIIFIVWLCKPSQMFDNQYGPVPYVD